MKIILIFCLNIEPRTLCPCHFTWYRGGKLKDKPTTRLGTFVIVSALHVYTKAVKLKFGTEQNDGTSGEECCLTLCSKSLKHGQLDIGKKKKMMGQMESGLPFSWKKTEFSPTIYPYQCEDMFDENHESPLLTIWPFTVNVHILP